MQYRDPFAKVSTANYSQSQATTYDAGLRAYMLKVYNYMASALALTGIVALFAANSEAFIQAFFTVGANGRATMSGLGWIISFAPLGLVMWLGFGLHRMSAGTAQAIFWAYSVVMGLSLSTLFLAFTGESIARAFFITAGTFGAMSLYGYTTKRDLTGMGSFLIMGLIGIIIASLVNLFIGSAGLQFAVSVLAVLIFTGLTAYDTQKIKAIYYQVAGSGEIAAKMAIMGALNLYMDFINIFIHLLHLFGDRR